jgi:all-trans-retinol 13,14-reductase
LYNTLRDLLPENIAKKSPCWPLTSAIKAATGSISVFMGIKGSPKELGLLAENVWVYTNSSMEDVSKF